MKREQMILSSLAHQTSTCTCKHKLANSRPFSLRPTEMMITATRATAIVLLLLSLLQAFEACGPGRGGARRLVIKHRPPLVQRQHIPKSDEHTVGASGPPDGPIRRKDARFRELVQNWNPDIEFVDQERTGADRMMSQRLKEKLSILAISVMNRWPTVRLRVIEGWDENKRHGTKSLHYEGRAVDITTSDKDLNKYGMLARLAVEAGFDWVHFEARTHVHCSVKSEKVDIIRNNGCFDGASLVRTPSGPVEMSQLQLNDLVLAMDSHTGKLGFSPLIMWLDRDEGGRELYVELTTSSGRLIRLTSSHLLYAAEEPPRYMVYLKESPATSASSQVVPPDSLTSPSIQQAAGNANKSDEGNYYYYYDTVQAIGANMNAGVNPIGDSGPSTVASVPNTNNPDNTDANSDEQQETTFEDVVFKTYARNLVVGQYLLVNLDDSENMSNNDPPSPSETTTTEQLPDVATMLFGKGRLSFSERRREAMHGLDEEDVQLAATFARKAVSVKFDQIVSIEYSLREGIYAPLTREGNIVVNSVVASCYAVIKDHDLAHLSFAPVRWLSYLQEWIFGLTPASPTSQRTVAALNATRRTSNEQDYEIYTQIEPKHRIGGENERRVIHWYPTMLYKLGRAVLPTSYLY